MDQFRLGLVDFRPYYYLDEDNTVGGILAPYNKQLLYFILDKVNVTFVRVPGSQKNHCSGDGICNGWLTNLQKGEVDFVNSVTLDELENVGVNLSLVPIIKEEYCFLAYKLNVHVNFLKPGFFDFIHAFHTSFWFYLMILSFSILALNGIILKLQENYRYFDTFWPQFGYILGQNFIVSSSIQRKCYFLVFLAGQLLVSKILSASLRTGLVQRSEYVRLDSFADVIRHNSSLFSSEVNPCAVRLRKSQDKLSQQVWKKVMVVVIKNMSPSLLATYMEEGLVFIATQRSCKAMKTYSCRKGAFEQKNMFFRVSENPVNQLKHGFLINKLNLKGKNKIIVNGLYSAFESGLISSKILEDLFTKLQVPFKPSPSCMVKDLEARVHVVPISMGYLTTPLFSFITGIGFSFLAFICTYLLQLLKKYYRRKKIDLRSLTGAKARFNS